MGVHVFSADSAVTVANGHKICVCVPQPNSPERASGIVRYLALAPAAALVVAVAVDEDAGLGKARQGWPTRMLRRGWRWPSRIRLVAHSAPWRLDGMLCQSQQSLWSPLETMQAL